MKRKGKLLLVIVSLGLLVNGLQAQTVKDIDGNIYHTAVIGKQEWMVENLKVSHYRNGDLIPNVTDSTGWSALKTGAWCNYDNSPCSDYTFGKLYNYYALIDTRKLSPVGWHIPSDSEWTALISYLGGDTAAGGSLKENSTDFWQSPDVQTTNKSGFTALPGGNRNSTGKFVNRGSGGYWWSSTSSAANEVKNLYLYFNSNHVYRCDTLKTSGLSVRCVKDR